MTTGGKTKFENVSKFSILNFTKQIVGKGISASNLYSFEVQGTDALRNYVNTNIGDRYGGDQNAFKTGLYKLNMLCNEIQIPGVDMTASDVKSPHKGLTQKMVSGKVYNELDIQFYCDLNSTPLSFFRAWQDMIMGNQHLQTFTQPINETQTSFNKESKFHSRNHQAYAQQYYDDYACNIIITKLEKHGVMPDSTGKKEGEKYKARKQEWDVPFKATLNKAYPYSMSSIPYNFGQAELVKVSVGFYYEYQTLKLTPSSYS